MHKRFKMLNVAGVVILYNPPVGILDNIQTYLSHLDKLIVFDNSEVKQPWVKPEIEGLSSKILFIDNPSNLGIPLCLNQASLLAIELGFDWLLTMDQDSYFESDTFYKYCERLQEATALHPKLSVLTLEHGNAEKVLSSSPFAVVRNAITSGSIINLGVWKELGGFEKKLFIDEVDTDYSFKNLINGFEIIKVVDVKLNHQLGTQIQGGYLSFAFKSNRTIHSPRRVYCMVRNYFYIKKKYSAALPTDVKERKKQLLVSLKNNLLFSGNFFWVLRNIIKGYIHFKRDIFY